MSGDFDARDTGTGSAASGGEVHARNVAGQDVQTFNIGLDRPHIEDPTSNYQTRLLERTYQRQETMCGEMVALKEEQQAMRKHIFGNGEVGLAEFVRRSEDANRRFRSEIRAIVIALVVWCLFLTVLYAGVVV